MITNRNKTALVWKDTTYSYNKLLTNVYAYADKYAGNVSKVAIFSENRPEWVFAFYSIWKNNSIAVPIDYLSTSDEVAYILNDCKPEVVFYSNGTKNVIESAINKLSYTTKAICLDEQQIVEETEEVEALTEPDRLKTAVIIYTSGTTGSPKGVMLSYQNIHANIKGVSEEVNIYNEEQRTMVLLPLHHIFPLLGTMVAPLNTGGTIAFSPSLASDDIMATLQNNKITIIIGVPRFYDQIVKGIKDKINKKGIAKLLFKVCAKVDSKKLSHKIFAEVQNKFGGHVKYLVCGGAKLSEVTGKDLRTLGFEVLEGFGMTEAAPMITFTRPGRVKIGSPGEALPGVEIKIVDSEVIARGENIMQGYYNKPEETSEVLKDGWLYTGDLGEIDDEGFLRITGRAKELIVLPSGKNITPDEVEKKITALSELVNEVGVYLEDDTLKAVVFPNLQKFAGKDVTEVEEVIKWDVIDKYNKAASPYKRVLSFAIVTEELPRTRLLKLKRFMLSSLASKSEKGKVAIVEPEFNEYRILKEYFLDEKKREVLPNDHLEMDLGLDSLDKVTLQVFVQYTFGVNLKEDDLTQVGTVEKLADFIRQRKTKEQIEAINWGEILRETTNLKLPESWFTYNILKNFARIILRMYFRLKAEGLENIPSGPIILAPNHQSFFDGLFVATSLKNKIFKSTYFYAKEKHVRKSWVKFIANRHNVIVMDINKDLKSSLQNLAEVLRKGRNIIIFPEGTRTRDGKLGDFKKTFAILSRELNVPVVPVAIRGAYEALPRGSRFPRPFKKISIKFYQPVYPKDHSYDSLKDFVYEKVAQFVH